jgi:hypothetical protein
LGALPPSARTSRHARGWIEMTSKKCTTNDGHVAADAEMDKAGVEKR